MKFWNKNKRARQHWTMIQSSIWNRIDIKAWCQRQSSTGRFYMKSELVGDLETTTIPAGTTIYSPVNAVSNIITTVYFEHPADATFFSLAFTK